jgi:hypothetical protein
MFYSHVVLALAKHFSRNPSMRDSNTSSACELFAL